MTDLFRVYQRAGLDGYPPEWHESIKYLVREQAGDRCLRCHHPYRKGMGEWSRCDGECTHLGPARMIESFRCGVEFDDPDQWREYDLDLIGVPAGESIYDYDAEQRRVERYMVESRWRILTVHHLNGVKLDCRWWNLAALCQRCHLIIQAKVRLEREFIREHSEWFKPFAAGWYAQKYLGLDLTRDETLARLDELLDLEMTQRGLW